MGIYFGWLAWVIKPCCLCSLLLITFIFSEYYIFGAFWDGLENSNLNSIFMYEPFFLSAGFLFDLNMHGKKICIVCYH